MDAVGKISVIIPVYNVEKYLPQCVESVLAQSYQNFEILLIDDGSTDQSPAICDSFAEKNTKIRVFHKANGGASTARNAGLDRASGEYVFFLDSDDYLDPQALEKLLSVLQSADADFAFCEAVTVEEESGAQSTGNYSFHRDYGQNSGENLFAEMVQKKEFHVAVWMNLYRRDFLEKNSLRFSEGIMYEDCIYAYQLYKLAEKAVHVHEYLYYRRYRAGSVMTSKKTARNFASAARAYREVVGFWKRTGCAEADAPYLSRIASNAIETYRSLDSQDKEKNADEYRSVIDDIKENKGFSDKALYANCYGKFFWFAGKAFGKLFGR